MENLRSCLTILNTQLRVLDTKSKGIVGSAVYEQLELGFHVFSSLFDVGLEAERKGLSVFKPLNNLDSTTSALIQTSLSEITKHQAWLQAFLSSYPNHRLDFSSDSEGVAKDICTVRSGVEFLLKKYQGIQGDFDGVLKNLEVYGEVESFDELLRPWLDQGFQPAIKSTDKPRNIPQSHWWWSS